MSKSTRINERRKVDVIFYCLLSKNSNKLLSMAAQGTRQNLTDRKARGKPSHGHVDLLRARGRVDDRSVGEGQRPPVEIELRSAREVDRRIELDGAAVGQREIGRTARRARNGGRLQD